MSVMYVMYVKFFWFKNFQTSLCQIMVMNTTERETKIKLV